MSHLAVSRPLSAPPRRGAPASVPGRPRSLRVLTRPSTKGDGPFVALCLTVLIGGLLSVLLLNTVMAQGSFELRELRTTSDELADIEGYLAHRVDQLSAPDQLARRASAMGMVPAEGAAFVRLSDGKVLGVAEPAKGDRRFKVVTGGTINKKDDLTPPSMTTTKVVMAGPIRTTTVRTVALDGTVTVTITRLDTRSKRETTSTTTSGGPSALGQSSR